MTLVESVTIPVMKERNSRYKNFIIIKTNLMSCG